MSVQVILTELLGNFFRFLPQITGSIIMGTVKMLGVLIIGWLIAVLSRQLVHWLMGKTQIDPILVSFDSKLVYYGVMAFTVTVALLCLNNQIISGIIFDLSEGSATRFDLKVVAAIFIFIVGQWIAEVIRQLAHRLLDKRKADPIIIAFSSRLVYYSVITFTSIIALDRLGVPNVYIAVALGGVGLTFGLVRQGLLANFTAGFFIVLCQPFKVGDLIEVAGTVGTVQDIQLLTTTLVASENKRVIIPNAVLTKDKIINYSEQGDLPLQAKVTVSDGEP